MTTKHVAISFLVGMTAVQAAGDLAKIEALVVDEDDGRPIPNIVVTASFANDNGWKAWTESAPINHDTQPTDSRGRCRLSGKTNNGEVGCWVDSMQRGYYGTSSGVGFHLKKKDLFGVWQPDNLVATIKLQRVERPIPLALRQFADPASDSVGSDLFSKGNGSLELDLLKGDWLPPVGSGEHADVVFTRRPREDLGVGTNPRGVTASAYRDSMTVKFVGEDNGLVEVACPNGAGIKIRNAPNDGYRQDYVCWKGRGKDLLRSSHFDKRRNFAFRIRTERDEKGKITSAYYGKIYGDIDFKKLIGAGVEVVAAPSFRYYLNPTPNDRNLEWDMKTNLCTKSGKIGREP